ncbi:MAG: cytochrome c oxidase accessory protein CcoG [Candidatus Competibacterales bacterium]
MSTSPLASEPPLYQKRIPIYPRSVKGPFRTLKTSILVLAYSVYFILPWVRYERVNAPDQAVLFDIPGRHFYIFGLTVQVQDLFWLAGLLMIGAWTLFFVTSIAGRVFCGYFCFQTLWTDAFMFIERWVQGDRTARIRLDKSPWTGAKIAKKGLTWVLWLALAFWTGLTFALYWGDAFELTAAMVRGEAPTPAYVCTFLLTFTTFVMAGLAREQVCTYMCPYGRFQSAMFDRDTLIVSYDANRGEGSAGRQRVTRDAKERDQRWTQGIGDCIDCGYCVQVCPTGIDIRNGLQYQCISCAQCVDACDTIMKRLGWPTGLVRYTSDQALSGGKTHFIKPKTLGYGVVLIAAISTLIWSIATRAPYTMAVNQVRQPLAVQLSDGSIQNSYELKLNNKLTQPVTFRFEIAGLPQGSLDLGEFEAVELEPQQTLRLVARVKLPPDQPAGQRDFTFVAEPVTASPAAPERPPLQRPAMFYIPQP